MAAQLLNTSTALLDPVGIMPSLTLGPFTPILPTAVVTDQMGEKWDINAPDDVNVSVGSDPSGLPHITFHFNYSPTSLFNSAAHGIETVHISPEVNNIGDATGFKAIVDFDVTNALPVTMGGFLTYLVDNEVATGPLDKGAVHPTNYSHVHNVPANAFAPEKLDLATPDFLPAAPGVAVSNLSATGVLNPGQTVRSDGMTMHQVELAGHDNGFTLNFFPFGDPSPSKPVINGLPASEVAPPHGNPFASVTVTDASILPIEVGTITINDVNGNPTDANGTLSNGVTKTGVGTYSVANAFPTDFTKTLDGIAFDPTANASGSFTLKVDNGDQNTTATESFTSQPGGGGGNPPMLVTTDGPTLSLNGHSWSLQNEQVMVDGVADATSLRVVALEVDQGRIYQENADKQWWSKAQPGDTWQQGAPPDGSADPPLHVSPDNTVVTDERHTIIDGGNNTWSIVGGQVSVNGQIDMNSARVIELAYENGAVWQENADQLWWAKHSPSDTWAPDDGTPNSPVIDNGVTANFVVANSGKPPPMGFLQPNSNDPTVVAPASAQPPTLGGSLQAAALASPANLPSVPGVLGAWGATINLDVVPVAMALMPNGNIVAWASDFPDSFQGDVGLTPTNTWSVVFDPLIGKTSSAIDTGVAADMFCPGIAYLADGRILVNGGDSSFHTSLYNASNGPLGTWTDSSNMNVARGYNATVTLSNGEVFTIGGSWSGGPEPKDGELWDPITGKWTLTGISDAAATYMDAQGASADPIDIAQRFICFGDSHNWLFAMPNGLVFDAGPKPQMNMIDPAGGTWWSVGNRGDDAYSINGIAVMYEQGKILKAGGAPAYTGESDLTGTIAATASAYVIDLTADYIDPHAAPTVTRISNMNEARAFANGVVLPDGEVFIVGGQANPVIFSDKYAVMTPEIWNPTTLKFTNLAPMPVPRDYHSTALLLGDGSVIVGGGGLCGGCLENFAQVGLTVDPSLLGADHPDYNIYRPAYLFNPDGSAATRPVLSNTPDKLVLGTELVVKASADTVAFSLVRFAATTHDIDTDQRRVSLTIDSKSADGTFTLNVPSDPGITVPGYWMLFAQNAHDTPSIAATVQVLPPGSVLPAGSGAQPATPGVPPAQLPGEVVLHGASSEYNITNNGGLLHIQDTVAVRDGVRDLSHVTTMRFSDGVGVFDPSGEAENVARLYRAALDRQPETAGLQYWTAQHDTAHVPWADIALDFVRSPEFIGRYGSLSDRDFVQQLYQNVLNRPGEAAGLQAWQTLLANGASRGTVLLGFSQSAEFQADTVSTGGDVHAAETYRLYTAGLGRTPDAAGAQYWSAQLAAGETPEQVAQSFVGSAEFQHDYGTLNVGDFVSALYKNILHRAGDTAGLQYWTDILQRGGSQAGVLVGFADSLENRMITAKATHADWVFMPTAH